MMPRRRILVGVLALAAASLGGPLARAATRPAVTVHRSPT
jgi:hypothetical protein